MANNESSNTVTLERMMKFINDPEPLREPPYACPNSKEVTWKDGKMEITRPCSFPNCFCEWKL